MIDIENNLFGAALYVAALYESWHSNTVDPDYEVGINAEDIVRDHAPEDLKSVVDTSDPEWLYQLGNLIETMLYEPSKCKTMAFVKGDWGDLVDFLKKLHKLEEQNLACWVYGRLANGVIVEIEDVEYWQDKFTKVSN
jgi:hypothetical protein